MKEMVGGCCVCSDERGWTENPLVYCDGASCNVAVHQACYGIVTVPTGPWYCRKCESQERAARVRCELCPQREGALKRTDTGGWCHVVCALFIPEAWFGNVQTMEPIILKGLPPEKFSKSRRNPTPVIDRSASKDKDLKSCYICEEHGREGKAASGACMQCNKNGCKQHFHVTCAQTQGLLCEEQGNYMDNVKYCGYCLYHYKKLKKDSHIKTIPAFKPIPTEMGTPELTPEKHPPGKPDHRSKMVNKLRERDKDTVKEKEKETKSARSSMLLQLEREKDWDKEQRERDKESREKEKEKEKEKQLEKDWEREREQREKEREQRERELREQREKEREQRGKEQWEREKEKDRERDKQREFECERLKERARERHESSSSSTSDATSLSASPMYPSPRNVSGSSGDKTSLSLSTSPMYPSPRNVSGSSSDKQTTSKSTGSLSGKFTTANFTETTITPSPANLFDLNDSRKRKQSPSASSSDTASTSGIGSSISSSVSLGDVKDNKFMANVNLMLAHSSGKQSNTPTSSSGAKEGIGVLVTTCKSPAQSQGDSSCSSTTSSNMSSPTQLLPNGSSPKASPSPLTPPSTTSSSFSGTFEKFIRGSYPSRPSPGRLLTSESAKPVVLLKQQVSPIPAVAMSTKSSSLSDPIPAKRQRTSRKIERDLSPQDDNLDDDPYHFPSSFRNSAPEKPEKLEKRKLKKSKVNNAKGRTVKDLLSTVPPSSSPSSSPRQSPRPLQAIPQQSTVAPLTHKKPGPKRKAAQAPAPVKEAPVPPKEPTPAPPVTSPKRPPTLPTVKPYENIREARIEISSSTSSIAKQAAGGSARVELPLTPPPPTLSACTTTNPISATVTTASATITTASTTPVSITATSTQSASTTSATGLPFSTNTSRSSSSASSSSSSSSCGQTNSTSSTPTPPSLMPVSSSAAIATPEVNLNVAPGAGSGTGSLGRGCLTAVSSVITSNAATSTLIQHHHTTSSTAAGLLLSESLSTSGPGVMMEPVGVSDMMTNGPVFTPTLIPPPRPVIAKVLVSPKSATPDAHNVSPLPTSMEQLLERQWEQGSAFLMEQGQHFDIASLLNCLHQLRQENQRLEEHIATLTSRRDHLLAVNARLTLPLTPINMQHGAPIPGQQQPHGILLQQVGPPHGPAHSTPHGLPMLPHGPMGPQGPPQGMPSGPPGQQGPPHAGPEPSVQPSSMNRSPRVNNYIMGESPQTAAPQDGPGGMGRGTPRQSPAQPAQSPIQNHFPAGNPTSQSHSPAGGSSNTTVPPGAAPEGRTHLSHPAAANPVTLSQQLTDAQRQMLLQQQQQRLATAQMSSQRGATTIPEQMYQMLPNSIAQPFNRNPHVTIANNVPGRMVGPGGTTRGSATGQQEESRPNKS